jgi:hypothetical protein
MPVVGNERQALQQLTQAIEMAALLGSSIGDSQAPPDAPS